MPDRWSDIRRMRCFALGFDSFAHKMMRRWIRFKYLCKLAALSLRFRPAIAPKRSGCSESHDDRPLPLLRQPEVQRIQYAPVRFVSQFLQTAQNRPQSSAIGNRGELAHILQNHCRWPFGFGDSQNLAEQQPALVLCAVAPADDAERLARKPGKQNVVVRHGISGNASDVGLRAQAKIPLVLIPARLVYVACKNTAQAQVVSRVMKSADAAEQIRKSCLSPLCSPFPRIRNLSCACLIMLQYQ